MTPRRLFLDTNVHILRALWAGDKVLTDFVAVGGDLGGWVQYQRARSLRDDPATLAAQLKTLADLREPRPVFYAGLRRDLAANAC